VCGGGDALLNVFFFSDQSIKKKVELYLLFERKKKTTLSKNQNMVQVDLDLDLDKASYKHLQGLCKKYNEAFEYNRMNCRNKKTTLRGVLKRARTWQEKREESDVWSTKAFQNFKGDLCGEKAPHGQVPHVSKKYVNSFVPMHDLGKGVYGNVKKVRKGNQIYALKTFHTDDSPALRKDGMYQATLSKTKKALEKEMTILANLHHPSIVRYCQAFYSEPGVGHILMDFVRGPTLLQAIERHTKEQRLFNFKSYTKQLLSALVYLHENGVAHLDVKPDNIVIDYYGVENRPVLVDFGMSCTQKMVGTEGPEPENACVHSFLPLTSIHPYYDINLNFEAIISKMKYLQLNERLENRFSISTFVTIKPLEMAKKILYNYDRQKAIPAVLQDFQRSDVFGMTRSLLEYLLGQTLGTYPYWSDERFFFVCFFHTLSEHAQYEANQEVTLIHDALTHEFHKVTDDNTIRKCVLFFSKGLGLLGDDDNPLLGRQPSSKTLETKLKELFEDEQNLEESD
jgi:serine/threonine protein kinase